ncbi:hypothetical protein ADUPG1_007308, partial [Aduncisulcus paluster]
GAAAGGGAALAGGAAAAGGGAAAAGGGGAMAGMLGAGGGVLSGMGGGGALAGGGFMGGLSSLFMGSAASGGAPASAGLFGAGGGFSMLQTMGTGGMLMGMLGGANSSSMSAAAMEYNAGVSKVNAEIAKENSFRDVVELEKAKRRDRRILSQDRQRTAAERRAQLGSSGIEFSGSAVDVLDGQNYFDALDAIVLIDDYETRKKNRVWSGMVQERGFQAEAGLSSYTAKGTQNAIAGNAVGSLLTQGSKLYGSRAVS